MSTSDWTYRGFDVLDPGFRTWDVAQKFGLEWIDWKGTSVTDIFHGDAQSTYFDPRSGDDWVYGGGGDDIIAGGGGNDFLYGGAGDDLLMGTWHDDHLEGGTGNDVLLGSWGDDTFVYRQRDFGEDKIIRFGNGQQNSGRDTIDFRGSGISWSDLTITYDGRGNAIVDAGDGNRILVHQGDPGSERDGLTQSNFLFGEAPAAEEPPPETRPVISVRDVRVNEGDAAVVRIELSKAYDKDVRVGLINNGISASIHEYPKGAYPRVQDFKPYLAMDLFYVTIKAGHTGCRSITDINYRA